jgi:hypothetical protein
VGLLAALVASVPVLPLEAGAKYTAQGFAIETEQKPQVVVVRPNLFMGTLDSANRQIEDPEWLAQAHINLQAALIGTPPRRLCSGASATGMTRLRSRYRMQSGSRSATSMAI